jgi:hypothetical protein
MDAADDRMLRQAFDTGAVQQLLAAYADVINRRAFAELDDLFLADCEVVIDTRRGEPTVVVGGSGVGDFVGPAIARFDFFEFVILSARLWVDGSDAARGRLYMCEIRQERESGERSQAFGVYHDRFRRTDEGWRFAARHYHSLARTATTGDRALEVFDFPSS